MEVADAIRSRRTIYEFDRGREIPAHVLMTCVEAGRWGQNHKRTDPWRFAVVGPEGRARIAERMVELAARDLADRPPEIAEAKRAKAEKKAVGLRDLPALVVVSMVRTPDDSFREREDYAAVATGVQNIALALWAEGIGMQWGTGDITRDAATYAVCGIDPAAEEIVGFLKIGYPAEVPAPRRRPIEDVTRHVP